MVWFMVGSDTERLGSCLWEVNISWRGMDCDVVCESSVKENGPISTRSWKEAHGSLIACISTQVVSHRHPQKAGGESQSGCRSRSSARRVGGQKERTRVLVAVVESEGRKCVNVRCEADRRVDGLGRH